MGQKRANMEVESVSAMSYPPPQFSSFSCIPTLISKLSLLHPQGTFPRPQNEDRNLRYSLASLSDHYLVPRFPHNKYEVGFHILGTLFPFIIFSQILPLSRCLHLFHKLSPSMYATPDPNSFCFFFPMTPKEVLPFFSPWFWYLTSVSA